MRKPRKLSREEIQSVAAHAVREAIDFVESEIAQERIKAQRYFDGKVDIGEEEGRSKIVQTKVRDTVRAVKPSLMRVFMSHDKFVEYTPTGPDDVAFAEQATRAMMHKFEEGDGYRKLNDAIHDALVKKQGVIKAWWEDFIDPEVYDLTNVSDEELMMLVEDPEIDILELETEEVEFDGMMADNHTLKVQRNRTSGRLCFDSVPPEELAVNREARDRDSCRVMVHRREMTVGELVEMGYEFEEVSKFSSAQYSDTFTEAEKFERRGYEDETTEENPMDPSMASITVAEAYMPIDADGIGIPRLHKLLLVGDSDHLLDYEEWGRYPFCIFEIDPEPHTFYGRSLADLLFEDQDLGTSMIRGMADNVAMTNNPRLGVLEDFVNMGDVLNNEIGAIVRMEQAGAIEVLGVPFIAGDTLGALQYFDQMSEDKTGVTKASTGLHPDALQSTTATAVAATVQAQEGQVEVMARNLAEGGMKQLFKLMLHLYVENADDVELMRLHGDEYEQVDPRSWNAMMDVKVNVGIGTGEEDQKRMMLAQALQIQQQIWMSAGPGNGLVSLTNIRNTLTDLLALNGLRNSERYFLPIDPQMEQQILQAAQQRQMAMAQGSDPNAAFLQAEQMKTQARMQTDAMREQNRARIEAGKLQLKAMEIMQGNDIDRDQMAQDLLIEAAKILGQYGTQVDVARVRNVQQQNQLPAPGISR